MDSPQNHIWGPHLWQILHSSAERIGSQTLKRLPQEETRIWNGLLSSLRFSLPCPQCKKHYTTYFTTRPINTFSQSFFREWLFSLHQQVNERTEKPNSLTINQVHEIYSKPFCFSAHFSVVQEQMTRAIRLGWCSRDDVLKTIRFLQELKRFYDFF